MIRHVGETPLVLLNNIPQSYGIKCNIYAKCEFLNPTGSSMDRVMKEQILRLPQSFLMNKGTLLVNGDGDECISASWISAIGKVRAILNPEKEAAEEKLEIGSSLGARMSPISSKPIIKTQSNISQCPTVPSKPFSILTNYHTIGKEIKEQLKGLDVKMLVCGNEASGMIYGLNLSLAVQQRDEDYLSVGVHFRNNSFTFNRNIPDSEEFQGEFPLGNCTTKKIKPVSQWSSVSDKDCYFMARRLSREEGLMVGPSSGGVLSAAIKAIFQYGMKDEVDANVVVVFNDSFWNGPRDFISNEWMLSEGHFLEENMESLYWWWEMPVSNVKMDATVFVVEGTTVEEAMEAMTQLRVSRAIVMSSADECDNRPIGIVPLGLVKRLVETGAIVGTDSLSGLYSSSFKTVDYSANCSEISPIFENYAYVLAVQKKLGMNKVNEVVEVEQVVGVIDQGNFSVYLNEVEKHHKDNFGILLSDGIPSCEWFRKNKACVEGCENEISSMISKDDEVEDLTQGMKNIQTAFNSVANNNNNSD